MYVSKRFNNIWHIIDNYVSFLIAEKMLLQLTFKRNASDMKNTTCDNL